MVLRETDVVPALRDCQARKTRLGKNTKKYVSTYFYIYIHTYIYVYMYIYKMSVRKEGGVFSHLVSAPNPHPFTRKWNYLLFVPSTGSLSTCSRTFIVPGTVPDANNFFFFWKKKCDNIFLIGLLWGLNEVISMKCLLHSLANSEYLVSDNAGYS